MPQIAMSRTNELVTLVLILAVAIHVTWGGYIPPSSKFKCPPSNRIWPCVCPSADDFGIRLKCEDVSLATLAAAIQFPSKENIPVLELHVTKFNTEKLYGNLFAGLQLKKLVIENSPVQKIFADSLQDVKDTIEDLEIWHSDLVEFPYAAFEQLSAVVNVTLDGHSISNLSDPIRGMPNLKFLRVSKGNISIVSGNTFSALGQLDRLDLHGNQLKAIPRDTFKNLKNCRYLDIAYNELTKLDPQNYPQMTKLTWFNASHNLISDFTRGAFARNSFLRVIYLTHNKLTKLDTLSLRGMTNLRRLYLSDNQIADVGRGVFSNVKKIGTIDLARNKIKVIDFEMFKSLLQPDEIILSENNITVIKSGAFSEMSYLMINISHNAISTIEREAFKDCVNITILDMSHNKIDNFTKTAFDGNTYPTEWRLQYNNLKQTGDIPLKSMAGLKILNVSHNALVEVSKNTFPKLYELHTVDFSHNNISKIQATVFTNLFSIRYINMSHNSLTDLGSMGAVPTLLELSLDHNRIRKISSSAFTRLSSLRSLSVTHNELKSVSQLSPGLSHLHLAHNQINSLEKAWPTMNALLTLDLSENDLGGNLDQGSFANLATLQSVNLARNNITEIPDQALSGLTTVQHINLEHNEITEIRRNAFGRLPVVFNLYLSHNKISNVSIKAFEGLLQLLHLDLSHNELEAIPEGALDGLVALRLFNVSHNRIERTENGQQSLFDNKLSLETVDLSHNQISEIYYNTFPEDPWIPYRLANIDLSHNQLVYVGKDIARGTKKLKRLNLSHNRIAEIKPNIIGNMTNLQVLDLSYNELPYIGRDQLGPPPNLTELYLQGNKIRRFPSGAVLPKAPLKLIDLTGNKITLFDTDFMPKIKNGSRIILEENPLKCDCRFILLKRFYNDFRPKLSNFTQEFYRDFERLKCGRDNHHVLAFNERDLLCDTNEDLQAPKIPLNYDLEIIIFTEIGNQVELKWRVKTKMDVAGFLILVKDENGSEIQKKQFLYNVRTATIMLDKNANEICLSPRYSRLEANQNALRVCQKLSKTAQLTSSAQSVLSSLSFYLLSFSFVFFTSSSSAVR